MADRRPSRSLVAVVGVALTALVAGFGVVTLAARPMGLGLATAQPASGPATTNPTGPTRASPSATSAQGPLDPTAGPTALVDVALVPVVAVASPERSIATADIRALLRGETDRHFSVSAQDLGALGSRLGLTPAAIVRAARPDAVRSVVAGDRTAIGILRASDVTPAVRALEVDGRALFGAARVRSLAAWPLVVQEVADIGTKNLFDPSEVWTLVAGGDVMLDRAAYRDSILRGKGVDFPWDGGTAVITSTRCCGDVGGRLPVGRRTGNAGAVAALLRAADVSLVNLEGPAPNDWIYHPTGLVFSFDPALLSGLKHAGVDAVTLANNHIANFGAHGILDTRRHLDALDIAHAGAGGNLASARRPAWLTAGTVRIAILGYDAIRPDLAATARRAGAVPLRLTLAIADIKAARAAGADVVIVMPHWGTEYTDAISATQRREAAALVDAGADAIIGSHSHWVGPVEMVSGHPVLFSLGDFIFELTYDRRTMEGVLADMTFVGRRLVQLDLHPTLILDGAQPNLLDPTGDGARLLADIRRASLVLPARSRW